LEGRVYFFERKEQLYYITNQTVNKKRKNRVYGFELLRKIGLRQQQRDRCRHFDVSYNQLNIKHKKINLNDD
jgi:hypothetical protein